MQEHVINVIGYSKSLSEESAIEIIQKLYSSVLFKFSLWDALVKYIYMN